MIHRAAGQLEQAATLYRTVLTADPNSAEGKELLGLSEMKDVTVTPFRVLPGDDTSCLNLYEPQQPRIAGVRDDFINEGRFRFQGSLDHDDRERANPWLLLTRDQKDEAIPVIADANSMTYVLHRSLGDDIVINHRGRIITLLQARPLTIEELATQLRLTANAVRAQLTAMERDGLVQRAGRRPGTTRPSHILAPMRSPPRNGSPNFIASRTRICRRFKRSAASACCSARSGSPRFCCGTFSSGAASSRCSARSATGRRCSA